MRNLWWVVLVGLLGWAAIAEARCVTHTITTADGRMITCTTCCYGSNCNTTCF